MATDPVGQRSDGRPTSAPSAGVEDFDRPFASELLGQSLRILFALEKAIEQREDGFQGIASAEVGDDLLLDFAMLAHRTDDTDVLEDVAVGRRDFDGSDEHDAIITSTVRKSDKLALNICHSVTFSECIVTTVFGKPRSPTLQNNDLRQKPHRHLSNMGY